MKVLLTSDLNPNQVNGVVISIKNLMKELEKKGVDVRLLCLSPSSKSYIDGNIYYMASFPFNVYPDIRASVFPSSKLMEKILDWKPDIIHSQCEFFTYSFVEKLAKKLNCPIIHTYHTLYRYYVGYLIPGHLAEKLVAPVMRRRLNSADVIVAPTVKTKKLLIEGGIGDHIVVIPTGIDLEKFENRISQDEEEIIKEELNIPRDAYIYGTVGRLAKEKNIDEILDCHTELIKSYDNVYLVLVGDGKYRKDLEDSVDRLGIRDRVRFTGMIEPNDIYKYYQILDFFVSASISETQGLTYIEALANGLPVVARRDTALEGVVEDGENGFIYDDVEGLQKNIEKLINNEELLTEMKKSADNSKYKFGTEPFGSKIYDLYKKTLLTGGDKKLQKSRFFNRISSKISNVTARSDYGQFYANIKAKWERSRFNDEKSKKEAETWMKKEKEKNKTRKK